MERCRCIESLYLALLETVAASVSYATYIGYHREVLEYYYWQCGGDWWRVKSDGYYYECIQHHMREVFLLGRRVVFPQSVAVVFEKIRTKIPHLFLVDCETSLDYSDVSDSYVSDFKDVNHLLSFLLFLSSAIVRGESNPIFMSKLQLSAFIFFSLAEGWLFDDSLDEIGKQFCVLLSSLTSLSRLNYLRLLLAFGHYAHRLKGYFVHVPLVERFHSLDRLVLTGGSTLAPVNPAQLDTYLLRAVAEERGYEIPYPEDDVVFTFICLDRKVVTTFGVAKYFNAVRVCSLAYYTFEYHVRYPSPRYPGFIVEQLVNFQFAMLDQETRFPRSISVENLLDELPLLIPIVLSLDTIAELIFVAGLLGVPESVGRLLLNLTDTHFCHPELNSTTTVSSTPSTSSSSQLSPLKLSSHERLYGQFPSESKFTREPNGVAADVACRRAIVFSGGGFRAAMGTRHIVHLIEMMTLCGIGYMKLDELHYFRPEYPWRNDTYCFMDAGDFDQHSSPANARSYPKMHRNICLRHV